MTGEKNNPNRIRVLERDRGKCQKCGSEKGIEVAHNVGRWAGGSDEMDNLIGLCSPCHFFQPDSGDKAKLDAYLAVPFSPLQAAWIAGWKAGASASKVEAQRVAARLNAIAKRDGGHETDERTPSPT